MQLKVELARPDRRVRVFGARGGEEGVRVLDGDLGRALQVGEAAGSFHHLARGAAAAVAVTERCQGARTPALVLVVADRVRHLLAGELGVVGVHRREVGEDPRAVDALPPEGVVGQLVGLVPGEFLGQEPLVPGEPGQLGKQAL